MKKLLSRGKIEKRVDKSTAFLFYLGLGIEILAVILDKSSWTNPYESLMFRAAFLLFVLRCVTCVGRYSKKERVFIAIMLLLAVADWHFSGRNDLIRILAFVCACRTVNTRKAALFSFTATIGGCLVLVGLAAAGVMGHLYQTYDYGHGMETRWDLGLGHPNSLHCMASMLLILGLYLFEKQMKIYIYLLLAVGNVLLFGLTRSNTAFVVGMAALILSFIMHCSKKAANGNGLYIAGELVLAAGIAFSLAAGMLNPAKHGFIARIDSILTGRISSLWETTFHEGTLSTWKWFGSRLNMMYFDMGWLRLLYWYGVIPAIVVTGLTFAMLEQARRTLDRAAFVMLICFAVYTVFEAHLVSAFAGRNYALFIAASYLPAMINEEEESRQNNSLQSPSLQRQQ